MKKLFTIGAVVLLGHIAGVSHALAGENVDQARVTQNLTSTPFYAASGLDREGVEVVT